ncbi:hypothetical protein ACHAWF_002501 [Thalassiosira exigua]
MAPNVTKVRDAAFWRCLNLKEVDLGNVTEIGRGAFQRCTSLAHLTLPRTVIEIGAQAFFRCEALVEVDLSHLELLAIGPGAFEKCTQLKSLIFPSTLVAIKLRAFSNCDSLQSVAFHHGLENIGYGAFEYCDKLENLIIPSTLKDIGKSAFQGCKSLRAVHFCEGVHHVGKGAFNECTSLGSINIARNSFVIEWGDDLSCALAEGTSIPSDDGGVERTVVSGYLGQSERFLVEVEEKINRILDRQDRIKEEKLELIRSMVYHVKMVDATTCLELALLKASMDKERNLASAPITRKRRREKRDNLRVICGAEIIIPNVLRFLYSSS